MSWLEKNYEKAAIGTAAVLALGLGALGWLKVNGVPEDFNVQVAGSGPKAVEVAGADLVTKAISSGTRDLSWTRKETADSRPVDILTGIPLFIPRSAPDTAIDLVTAEPVHPPIKNTWWLQYRLDPGFADSPQRDEDGDGYNNLEEFNASTNPIDKNSHPSLLDKLKYVKDESSQWALRPQFPEMNGQDLSGCKLHTPETAPNPTNKTPMGATLKPGALFFTDGVAKNRFKYLGTVTRDEENPRTHVTERVTYARIEDLAPNKKGTVYEIPAPLQESRINDFAKFDRSAVFSLEAAGNEGKPATIAENTTFSLPFGGAKKEYLLKKVTPESVEVEHIESKASVTIPKGGFPTRKP